MLVKIWAWWDISMQTKDLMIMIWVTWLRTLGIISVDTFPRLEFFWYAKWTYSELFSKFFCVDEVIITFILSTLMHTLWLHSWTIGNWNLCPKWKIAAPWCRYLFWSLHYIEHLWFFFLFPFFAFFSIAIGVSCRFFTLWTNFFRDSVEAQLIVSLDIIQWQDSEYDSKLQL